MKKELQDALRKDFPNLFSYKPEPDRPFWPIILGINCGDGWEPLIRRLCSKLEPMGNVIVFQIKEKFGGLRFYVNYGDQTPLAEGAHEAIDQAELESLTTCEDCGQPGKLRDDRSWVRTLCLECSAKDLEWSKNR